MKLPIMFTMLHDIEIAEKNQNLKEINLFNDKLIKENAEYRKHITKLEKCIEKLENLNCELNIKLVVSESKLSKK